MLIIPLYIFLLIYLVFLAVFASFYLVFIYHLVTAVSLTIKSIFVAVIIFGLSFLVVFTTIQSLSGTDWQLPAIEFNFNNWFNF